MASDQCGGEGVGVGELDGEQCVQPCLDRRVPLAVALGRQCWVDGGLRIASQCPRQWHTCDAAQTNANTDSWAGYDTAVNGLITAYWNAEAEAAAAADAAQTQTLNAAYVGWATAADAAYAAEAASVAAARADEALANAGALNSAWHAIHTAAKADRKVEKGSGLISGSPHFSHYTA